MSAQQLPKIANQTTPPTASIDVKSIIEHGESPTAIILAIAILIAVLFGSMTGLVRVIVMLILRQTKPSQ